MERQFVTTFSLGHSLRPSVMRSSFLWATVVGVSIFVARSAASLGLAHHVHEMAEAILVVSTLYFGSVLGWKSQWAQMIGIPFFGCFAFFLAVIAGEMVNHGPISGFFLGVVKGIFEGLVMYFVFASLLALGGIVGCGGRKVIGHDHID